VIANKTDLETRVAVGAQDGHAFANSIGFEFFEVSAMQNKSLEEPFKALAHMFQEKYNDKVESLTA
jgi:hypothetical protein